MENTLFLTYNSGVVLEESTALRLQTIANLYGIRVDLPDRYGPTPNENTRSRIVSAKWVVAFCFEKASKRLIDDLNAAIESSKPLIIIYSKERGELINFAHDVNVHKVLFDFNSDNIDNQLEEISHILVSDRPLKSSKKATERAVTDSSSSGGGALLAILGIGLALLALWALSNSDS